MEKGITGSGSGFDAPSMGRLGGHGPVPIHNPPAHQLKNAALKVCQPCTTAPCTSLAAHRNRTHLAVLAGVMKTCCSTRTKQCEFQR